MLIVYAKDCRVPTQRRVQRNTFSCNLLLISKSCAYQRYRSFDFLLKLVVPLYFGVLLPPPHNAVEKHQQKHHTANNTHKHRQQLGARLKDAHAQRHGGVGVGHDEAEKGQGARAVDL